jgi:hypothetical protein
MQDIERELDLRLAQEMELPHIKNLDHDTKRNRMRHILGLEFRKAIEKKFD